MSLSDQVAVNARPGFWSAHGLHVEFVERGSQLQNARYGSRAKHFALDQLRCGCVNVRAQI